MTDGDESLNLILHDNNKEIPKTSFEKKKVGKDGLVLHVHHSLPGPKGKVSKHHFTSASFDLAGERLAVSDSMGNTFIIDLLYNKFWMLPKLPASNFIVFSKYNLKRQEILVGSVSGPLLFVNVESGETTGELVGHREPALHVSFCDLEPYCLTVCVVESGETTGELVGHREPALHVSFCDLEPYCLTVCVVESGETTGELVGHREPALHVSFCDLEPYCLTVCVIESGETTGELVGHREPALHVSFCDLEPYCLTVCVVESGETTGELVGHREPALHVSFCDLEPYCLTVCVVESGETTGELVGHREPALHVSFCDLEPYCLTVCVIESGETTGELVGHREPALHVSFCDLEPYCLTVCVIESGETTGELVESGETTGELVGHREPALHVSFCDLEPYCLTVCVIESGETTGELVGHREPALHVSFCDLEPYCLTVCSTSAIIWDLRTNCLVHQLTLRSSICIKLVRFMPVSNHILGLFDDSSVHVWRLDSLVCTKQMFPEDWGGRNIRAVAFTRNGRGMVLAGQSAALAVFVVDNWTLQKLITLPDNFKAVKHLEFVPQLFDGGANKILAVLTTNCVALFVDTESSILLRSVEQVEGCVNRLESSLSGKYVVLLMQTGEVDIFSSSQLIFGGKHQLLVSEAQTDSVAKTRTKQQHHEQINKLVDLSQLRPILKEFGEYPEAYRKLIWKTILELPENQSAYVTLINKGIHPAFATLDKVFPLSDRSLSSSVKRLLSCLAYWSPIFLQVKHLPIFVLPFVKLIRHDQFACFETVASVIVNWCQGWFQFVPYPPLHLLDTVKALLASADNQLMAHFNRCHVTADLYVWSLLETAFYEVLGWKEWQQLWDHVLSNHPALLLFFVVAFNITCRSSLMNLHDIEDFEHFYHTEVMINMNQLISKCYQLWTDTRADKHPKHQLTSYKPLLSGNMYQIFTDYPKHLLDNQLEKLSSFYDEQEFLKSQENNINNQKVGLDAEQKQLNEASVKENRLKELEQIYRHALKREENLLEEQRQSLLAARRELRGKEAVVRSQSMDKTLQEKADKYAQLEKLMDQLENKKGTSDFQSCGSWSSSHQSSNPSALRLQHASAVYHLSKLKKLHQQTKMRHPELKMCSGKFEDLLRRIEIALDEEKISKHLRPCHTDQFINLEEETQALEDEAQRLLRKLSTKNHKTHCLQCSDPSTCGSKIGQSSCYCCGDTKRK
ncbi:TBC1 domain family member 31-like [Macrosteles quadrilineatus]|uniref:TBC1 domain family member 31-like n=1 Tax=Macrosteles quadrilineatus TaxID=74068 RepID=UPI0023E0C244|nr:TBC1 domain family member 31-like [Macrosteles quadrilineatus]